jgi:hypothetical protein
MSNNRSRLEAIESVPQAIDEAGGSYPKCYWEQGRNGSSSTCKKKLSVQRLKAVTGRGKTGSR